MLATYLGGPRARELAVLAGRWIAAANPWRLFGLLIAGAGAASLLTVASIGPWLPDAQIFAGMWAMRATGRETLEMAARFVVAAAARPARADDPPRRRLSRRGPARGRRARASGRGVGAVVSLNTAGGIAGTMLTGFVLVPAFGLVRIARACWPSAGALRRRDRARPQGGAAAVAARATRGRAVWSPPLPWPRSSSRATRSSRLLAEKRGGRLLFYEEDTGRHRRGARAAGRRRIVPAALHPGRLELGRRADVARGTCASRPSCRS